MAVLLLVAVVSLATYAVARFAPRWAAVVFALTAASPPVILVVFGLSMLEPSAPASSAPHIPDAFPVEIFGFLLALPWLPLVLAGYAIGRRHHR